MYQPTEKAKNVEIIYNDSPQSLQKVANLPEIIIDEQLSSLVPQGKRIKILHPRSGKDSLFSLKINGDR